MESNHAAQEHRGRSLRPCGERGSVQVGKLLRKSNDDDDNNTNYLVIYCGLRGFTHSVFPQGWRVAENSSQREKLSTLLLLISGSSVRTSAWTLKNKRSQEAQSEALQRHISHHRPVIPTRLSSCCSDRRELCSSIATRKDDWKHQRSKILFYVGDFFLFLSFIALFSYCPSKSGLLIFWPDEYTHSFKAADECFLELLLPLDGLQPVWHPTPDIKKTFSSNSPGYCYLARCSTFWWSRWSKRFFTCVFTCPASKVQIS